MASDKSVLDEDKVKEDEIGDTGSNSDVAPVEKQAVTPLTPPAPEVDGGARAWLQVLGSFLVFGNLWEDFSLTLVMAESALHLELLQKGLCKNECSSVWLHVGCV